MMSQKRQLSLRMILGALAGLGLLLALAKEYGVGRGLLCLLALFQATSSLLFFWTGMQAWRDDHRRNAVAAAMIGILILAGSLCIAWLVFQPVEPPVDPFSRFDIQE